MKYFNILTLAILLTTAGRTIVAEFTDSTTNSTTRPDISIESHQSIRPRNHRRSRKRRRSRKHRNQSSNPEEDRENNINTAKTVFPIIDFIFNLNDKSTSNYPKINDDQYLEAITKTKFNRINKVIIKTLNMVTQAINKAKENINSNNKHINAFHGKINDFITTNAWIKKRSEEDNLVQEKALKIFPDLINRFYDTQSISRTNKSFMQQIDLLDEDRLFVIGDIHARKKTIEEIIEVLNQAGAFEEIPLVEEEETLTLKENVKVVFLGDYVDRGGDDLTVLNTLLKLKLKNPKNVFILQGNHENEKKINLFRNSGPNTGVPFITSFIKSEDNIKMHVNPDHATEQVTDTYQKFFNLLPKILFINFNGKVIQLSHAGPSRRFTEKVKQFLSSTDEKIEIDEDNNEITNDLLWTRLENESDVVDMSNTIKNYSEKIVISLRGHDHELPAKQNNKKLFIKQIGYFINRSKPSESEETLSNNNFLNIITLISGSIYDGTKAMCKYYSGLIEITSSPEDSPDPFSIKYHYLKKNIFKTKQYRPGEQH